MGFKIRQIVYVGYMLLQNKLPQNLVACDNNNYLLSSMVLWVRDSDRAQWRSLVSAPRCLVSQLEDLVMRLESSGSSFMLTWALLDLSARTPTHGPGFFTTWSQHGRDHDVEMPHGKLCQQRKGGGQDEKK